MPGATNCREPIPAARLKFAAVYLRATSEQSTVEDGAAGLECEDIRLAGLTMTRQKEEEAIFRPRNPITRVSLAAV